jgi:hypothetical protein
MKPPGMLFVLYWLLTDHQKNAYQQTELLLSISIDCEDMSSVKRSPGLDSNQRSLSYQDSALPH